MKKLILLLQFVGVALLTSAQVGGSPNFTVRGTIRNASNNQVVPNYTVNIQSLNGTALNGTGQTNAAGFYSITLTNGSVIGPNRYYAVSTADCNNHLLRDTVHNGQGTVDTVNVNFEICHVAQICSAAFTVIPSPSGVMNYYFSPNSPDTAYSYRWTVNGTLLAETMNAFKHFTEPGTYTVCLRVQRGNSSSPLYCVNEFCREVVVENNTGSEFCNARFEFTTNTTGVVSAVPVAPYSPNFTYTWTDDIHNLTYSGYDPAIQIFEGNNHICFHVTDNAQCAVSFCDTLFVPGTNQGCNADYQYEINRTNGGAPYTVHYVANQSDTITYEHSWYFGGDSQIYHSNRQEHDYANSGNFTVCHFLVNTATGCRDTVCKTISLQPDTTPGDCNAHFNFTTSTANALRILFNNVSTPTSASTYSWVFSDNTTSNVINPEHTFPASGVYTACLTITHGNCTDTFCDTLTVGQNTGECVANFSNTASPANPLRMLFTNLSNPLDGSSFIWNIGNGTQLTSVNLEYTFPAPGIYPVCLYLQNGSCTDTICKNVSVSQSNGNCSAEFTIDGNLYHAPATLHFLSSSANQTGIHRWVFSDGTISEIANPVMTFSDSGNYAVCHYFYSSLSNCADTACQEFTIGSGTSELYTIAGQVFAGANAADHARVRLIRFDPVSHAAVVVDETFTNAGYYHFVDVEAGVYLIKAALLENSIYHDNYVPTYFGSQFYWFNAEPVYLTASGSSYNISLIYAGNAGGPGQIGGTIDDDPFRVEAGGANPVAAADVIITDITNNPQRWTVTNLNGEYTVTNLAYGTYRLFADITGLVCVPIEFTLSPDVPAVNITLHMGDGLTGIVEPIYAILQGEVFPNPAASIAQLNLNLKTAEKLDIQLTSVTGQNVWRETQTFGTGKQLLRIPTASISAGIYILSLKDSSNRLLGTRKITVGQ
jgi:PKD repeat protein